MKVSKEVLLRTHGIKHPRDIFFCDSKDSFADLPELVQLRQCVNCLVQTSCEPSEDDHVELRAGGLYGTRWRDEVDCLYLAALSFLLFREGADALQEISRVLIPVMYDWHALDVGCQRKWWRGSRNTRVRTLAS